MYLFSFCSYKNIFLLEALFFKIKTYYNDKIKFNKKNKIMS
jgi:hypothetical protein